MKKSYTATFKAQVVLEVLKETKTIAQLASEHGIHPNVLREWKIAAIKGLPDVFISRDSVLSHTARRALVEHDDTALPLTTQAALLRISRRSLYDQPAPPPPEEVAIKHRIDALSTAHPFYGSRKLTVLLEPDFGPINRKRVQRSMREMGIAGVAPGPNLSRRAQQQRVCPYLLRGVIAQAAHAIGGCDSTSIRLRNGWRSLVALLDWFSRSVVSWALDDTLALPFVLDAVGQALRTATPHIWNTDQGSPFTSPLRTAQIAATGACIRMDGKGRAIDNIFIERLWRSVKYEEVYRADDANPSLAADGPDVQRPRGTARSPAIPVA
jgi:putative transposase